MATLEAPRYLSELPKSLAISPNLEALLEHDDKIRRAKADASNTTKKPPSSPGLPPPPRPKKNAKTSTTDETTGSRPSSSDSGSVYRIIPANPFVNPSPTFPAKVEVLHNRPPRSSSMMVVRQKEAEGVQSITQAISVRAEGGWSPTAETGSEHQWQQLSQVSRSATLPRSEAGGSKAALETGQKIEDGLTAPSTSPSLRERSRSRRKLVKPIKIVMDTRAAHRRGTSTSSSSTTASSDEQISISSTIRYPSSSGHSHRYHDQHRASYIEVKTPTFGSVPMESPSPTQSFISFMSPPPRTTTFDVKKPPVPTAPKPNFSQSNLGLRASSQSPRSSPKPSYNTPPPTVNLLNPMERADLVRKSRKLAQVFGQTPEAQALSGQQEPQRSSFLDLNSDQKSTRKRSTSRNRPVDDLQVSTRSHVPSWPPPEGTQYLTASGRRHSSPLTPDEFSFLSTNSSDNHSMSASTTEEPPSVQPSARADSPTSFIDLSDEEDDIISTTPRRKDSRPRPSSPSNQSFMENMTPEELEEEERRRKRDKLAKLHRFLGSRVPTSLVLGVDHTALLSPVPEGDDLPSPSDTARSAWLRRRRSSSAAAFPSMYPEDLERLKEELSEQEKAINVRRAIKMEKVFGVAPPQTLYHTRSKPNPPASPDPPSLSPFRSAAPSQPYRGKSKRPGTSDSADSQAPLLRNQPAGRSDDFSHNRAESLVYAHYQHSLHSLNDIIDRHDTESLAELHEYLNSKEEEDDSPPLQEFSLTKERPTSMSTIKSERRRSLPARTSIISLASEYSLQSPSPEVTNFQVRRRRAAKLTQFFGVDYRDLIRDVLESIETGVEHEKKRGTINPEEAEDLLRRLRSIKTKRDGTF